MNTYIYLYKLIYINIFLFFALFIFIKVDVTLLQPPPETQKENFYDKNLQKYSEYNNYFLEKKLKQETKNVSFFLVYFFYICLFIFINMHTFVPICMSICLFITYIEPVKDTFRCMYTQLYANWCHIKYE